MYSYCIFVRGKKERRQRSFGASLLCLLGKVLQCTRAAFDISPKLQHVRQAVNVKSSQPLHFPYNCKEQMKQTGFWKVVYAMFSFISDKISCLSLWPTKHIKHIYQWIIPFPELIVARPRGNSLSMLGIINPPSVTGDRHHSRELVWLLWERWASDSPMS